MKKYIIFLFALANILFAAVLPAQNAGLSLQWDGAAYVVKMEVVSGASPLFLGSSQITIVTPAAVSTAGIMVNCVSPCSGSTWAANTFVNAPAAAPGSNFVAVANTGSNMGAVAGGSSVTLFTFTLTGGCDAGVRLFVNGTDPNSGQMPGGQDFSNVLVNGLINFDFYNGVNSGNVICAPAPLDLLRFSAVRENAYAHLSWNAENEIDLSHYSIQRSLDGQTFVPVESLSALNIVQAAYDWLDVNIPARATTVFYRLEIIDNDQRSSFSPVRTVNFDRDELQLTISPVPATREITLSVYSPDVLTAEVEIWTQQGRQLFNERKSLETGENQIKINTTDWPAGTYFARVKSGRYMAEQRLIITK